MCVGHQGDVWVEYTHPSAIAVTQYAIVSANDEQDRDPSSWVLFGSNDGEYYVELDRRIPKEPLFTGRKQKKIFLVEQSSSFTHYKLLFLSVRDKSKKNGLQIAELELYTGACANCTGTSSQSKVSTTDLTWATFPNRVFVSAPISKKKISLDECKAICAGEYKATCAGVSMSTSGECCVHSGKGDLKSSPSMTAYMLVGSNLMSPIKTRMESPRETKVHTIKWDRKGIQANTAMPSLVVFRGETVVFEWVDTNSYFGHLTGLGPNEGRGPHGKDVPNHHSIVRFHNRLDFMRCDFRTTSNYDHVGSYPIVRWVAQEPGTYYFGSSYTDPNHKDANGNAAPINDCKRQLKMTIIVERRM